MQPTTDNNNTNNANDIRNADTSPDALTSATNALTQQPDDMPQPQPTGHLPSWLKRPLPKGKKFEQVVNTLQELKLDTVCSEAHCPNRGECYSCGTATFMIMGKYCTRNCAFCAVGHGQPQPLEDDEPARLARAVQKLKLKHVVITTVTRDDLPDGGANHFARVITELRKSAPAVRIEVLTSDFGGATNSLDIIYDVKPDIFNHNIETTRRLTKSIRSKADYDRSLSVLQYMAQKGSKMIIKSGFMLGLGEKPEEITEMLCDLHNSGVEMLTIGQYLRPGRQNWPVYKYYSPKEFDCIKKEAETLGFSHVSAGPFVRSSYHAEMNMLEREKS